MPALSVMFKTVSTDCNLDCTYCYYRESLEGTRVRRRLDLGLLERFIPIYMAYVADVKVASMSWQGGEPTLAGLSFFERVVALQATHAAPGTLISNALQTNAVLLDDAWGAFLKGYNWLVGVSLDGPEEIHDALRTDRGGQGSFARVMRGIDVLRRHQVDFNILCVLGPHNVGRASELMRFLRTLHFSHVQFIPAMDFQAIQPDRPPSFLITPAEYGAFLVEASLVRHRRSHHLRSDLRQFPPELLGRPERHVRSRQHLRRRDRGRVGRLGLPVRLLHPSGVEARQCPRHAAGRAGMGTGAEGLHRAEDSAAGRLRAL